MVPDSRGISKVLSDHWPFHTICTGFPIKSQKAHAVAKTLVDKYFVHYGLHARIHSDQGRDFESRLIKELLRLMEICKSRTTPYHPQEDPQPERFNRPLLYMLGTLSQERKRHWSQHVGIWFMHAIVRSAMPQDDRSSDTFAHRPTRTQHLALLFPY